MSLNYVTVTVIVASLLNSIFNCRCFRIPSQPLLLSLQPHYIVLRLLSPSIIVRISRFVSPFSNGEVTDEKAHNQTYNASATSKQHSTPLHMIHRQPSLFKEVADPVTVVWNLVIVHLSAATALSLRSLYQPSLFKEVADPVTVVRNLVIPYISVQQ